MKMWIEMRRDINCKGDIWDFKKSIWAPTYKNGKNKSATWLFWENIKEVKSGDLIFHLVGKGKLAKFVGYSIADTDGHRTNERPVNSGDWEYCDSFYRVFLKDFKYFIEPINIYDVFIDKKEDLERYIYNKENPKNIFFTIQNKKLQCLNGAYLTELDESLVEIIFKGNKLEEKRGIIAQISTSGIVREVKTRMGQEKFAENVKKNYNYECCFPGCNISDSNFLVASHIARWADNLNKRGNTSNGLCLCVFHDKAFENGYFILDSELRICKSSINYKSEVYQKFIYPYIGKSIKKGAIKPDEEVLKEHRNRFGYK